MVQRHLDNAVIICSSMVTVTEIYASSGLVARESVCMCVHLEFGVCMYVCMFRVWERQ